jgi:hypothetical protein
MILVIIADTLCLLCEKTALCIGENSLIQPLYPAKSKLVKNSDDLRKKKQLL